MTDSQYSSGNAGCQVVSAPSKLINRDVYEFAVISALSASCHRQASGGMPLLYTLPFIA
jgi:hypothetical protein